MKASVTNGHTSIEYGAARACRAIELSDIDALWGDDDVPGLRCRVRALGANAIYDARVAIAVVITPAGAVAGKGLVTQVSPSEGLLHDVRPDREPFSADAVMAFGVRWAAGRGLKVLRVIARTGAHAGWLLPLSHVACVSRWILRGGDHDGGVPRPEMLAIEDVIRPWSSAVSTRPLWAPYGFWRQMTRDDLTKELRLGRVFLGRPDAVMVGVQSAAFLSIAWAAGDPGGYANALAKVIVAAPRNVEVFAMDLALEGILADAGFTCLARHALFELQLEPHAVRRVLEP